MTSIEDNQSIIFSDSGTTDIGSFYHERSFQSEHENDNATIKTTDSLREKKANRSCVHTISKNILVEKKDGSVKRQTIKIHLYNTAMSTGSRIVNAVTGYSYSNNGKLKYTVGSSQEDDLFKVRFNTFQEKVPGITLFFDSPEQYERHLGKTVNESIKMKFYEKQKRFERKMFQSQ